MVITNTTRGVVLADRAEIAWGLFKRVTGLLTRRTLPQGEAFIIPRCRSIHTYFMRFPIDVIFLRTVGNAECGMRNAEWKLATPHAARRTPHSSYVVVRVIQSLSPFRVVWKHGADTVLELPADTISRTSTSLDERIAINFASQNLS